MKIVYLHGLGSSGVSYKSDTLKETFGNENVLSPNLPLDPTQTIELVTALVSPLLANNEVVTFVGTSLGGFWANYFGQKFESQCVIVNPMLIPGDAFVDRIGTLVTHYDTDETTLFTPEIVRGFKHAQTEVTKTNTGLVSMFLARDDDVIDYRTTLEQMQGVDTYITDDGGHRYEENWDMVVALLCMMNHERFK